MVVVAGMAGAADWSGVEGFLGRKGTIAGDVIRFAYPRTDLKVKVGDVKVETALALTAWLAFQDMGGHAMVMGDLVLKEDEVKAVVARVVANHLQVLAIHNHLVGEKPRVLYMHVGGSGDAAALARGMADVLKATKIPAGEPAAAKAGRVKILPDWIPVETILGRKGQAAGSVIKFSIPRSETIMDEGMPVPPGMGTATAINLEMTGKKAATTGDFVLLAGEVNPVVEALTKAGIMVTAIHSHMLTESPRLFFLHFWGVDNPAKLAEGLKAALDQVNLAPGN
jgi:hypothetical protein